MSYDLKMLQELCDEVGYKSTIVDGYKLVINLNEEIVFNFINGKDEENCLACFDEGVWHVHGVFEFYELGGPILTLDYLDLIEALSKGEVFVCDIVENKVLKERFLVHKKFFQRDRLDDLGDMKSSQMIIYNVMPN